MMALIPRPLTSNDTVQASARVSPYVEATYCEQTRRYTVTNGKSGGSLRVCFYSSTPLGAVALRAPCAPKQVKLSYPAMDDVPCSTSTYGSQSIVRSEATADTFEVRLAERDRGQLWDEVVFDFEMSDAPIAVEPLFKISYDRALPPLAECVPEVLPDDQAIALLCSDGVEVRMSRSVFMLTCEYRHFNKEHPLWTISLRKAEDFSGFHSAAVLAMRDVLTTRIVPAAVLLTETSLALQLVGLLYFLQAFGKERVWPVLRDLMPMLTCAERVRVMSAACAHGDPKTVLASARLMTKKNSTEAERTEAVVLMLDNLNLFGPVDDPAGLAVFLRQKKQT